MIVLIDHVFNDYARKIGTHLISNSRDKGTNAPTSPVKKWEETEEESEQSTARRRFNPRARAPEISRDRDLGRRIARNSGVIPRAYISENASINTRRGARRSYAFSFSSSPLSARANERRLVVGLARRGSACTRRGWTMSASERCGAAMTERNA